MSDIESNDGDSILQALYSNNIIKFKELINNDNINKKNNNGYYPLILAIISKKIEIIKFLIDYANINNVSLNINEKVKDGEFPLLSAIDGKSIEIVKLLMEYTNNKNNITLEINGNDDNGNFPLLCAINNDDTEIVQLLLDYTHNKDNIILNINKKDKNGNFPLLSAIKNNNTVIVQLLLDYANANKVSLNINEKNNNKDYPVLSAIINNNIEMVKLLIEYANNKKEYLKIKERNNKGHTPILKTIDNNNVELFKLLVEYSKEENINLEIHEEGIELEISKIDDEFKNSLYKYNKERVIEIINTENSKILEIFDKIKRKEIKKKRESNFKKKAVVFNDFAKNMNNSIILIEYDENDNTYSGTGFFIKCSHPITNKKLYLLITNNHVLNEKKLKSGETFRMCMASDIKKTIEISIKHEDFIFTSELIDITFIEFNDKKIIKKNNLIFLDPSDFGASINESILIFQYNEDKLKFTHGTIKSSYSFNYYHRVATINGSSGSPLLNENSKVVGIHKAKKPLVNGENEDINMNIAVKFSEVNNVKNILYSNDVSNNYNTKKAKKSAKKLSKEELSELRNEGLDLKISYENQEKLTKKINRSEDEEKKEKKLYELKLLKKSLFYCTFSENLLFYRTNYSWYITIISEENNISKYNLENIKQLNWLSINSINDKLNRNIKYKFNDEEYKLINGLKLKKLDYLIETINIQ